MYPQHDVVRALDLINDPGAGLQGQRALSGVDRPFNHITQGRWHFTALFTLHPAPRATGERGARARQHRLRRVEHDSTSSAKSFIFVHHTQQLPAPAQVGDAKGTRKKITEIKMCLIKDALKATAGGAKP